MFFRIIIRRHLPLSCHFLYFISEDFFKIWQRAVESQKQHPETEGEGSTVPVRIKT